MKKILIFLLLSITTVTLWAQKPADLNKAVVNVITYDAQDNVLDNVYGFFVGTQGEVVAPYKAFVGAVRADVITWQGQKASAQRIIGASSAYDLVRFTTDVPTKKLIGLTVAAAPAQKDQTLQMAYYSSNKKSLPESTTITAADPYNDHYYYEVSTPNDTRYFGCPILNGEGQVVALVQKNVMKDATTACAIDVSFATELTTSVMSSFNKDLNSILMPKQIPSASEEDAFSYVYMLLHSQLDKRIVVTATEDFIAAYPDNGKVYNERATYYAQNVKDYAAAERDLAAAIEKGGDNLSEAYYTQSVLMYNKMLNEGAETWPQWTLDTALGAAEKAYGAKPQPIYLLQQGQILFTQTKYQEAYDAFEKVNASDMANAQTFYYAASALERAGGDSDAVLALLDSVVTHLATPYTAEAAPYLFVRAQHLDNAGQHRRATKDYNDYEALVGTRNLNAYFYYLRMQSEIGCRMYQQALDDAHTAISRAATNEEKVDYLYDCACLQLRVGMNSECVASCEALLALDDKHAEGYKICGIAYGELKQKAKAKTHLQKALELGAQGVESLLEKYK